MRIAYLGRFPFPGSTAPTHRVDGIATALSLAGHEVTIVPMLSSDTAEAAQIAVDTSLARKARSRSISNAASILLGGTSARRWLLANASEFDLVILYGTPAALLARVLADQRRKNKIPPVILDIVEWYEHRHRPGGRFGPFSLEHAIAMRGLAPQAPGAICISTYLDEYLAGRSVKTITVPPLFSMPPQDALTLPKDDERIHIGYAGSPGSKDGPGLRNLISAAAQLPPHTRQRLCIEIVGVTQAQAQEMWGGHLGLEISRNPDWLRWHGVQPHNRAQALVAGFDFTYLQRPSMRYAAAGFPTKVVESLILGTPVIANLTSDLSHYIHDGQNGVVLGSPLEPDGASEESTAMALERIQSAGFELGMSRAAIRAEAHRSFSPINHSERLDQFVRRVVEASQNA